MLLSTILKFATNPPIALLKLFRSDFQLGQKRLLYIKNAVYFSLISRGHASFSL